MTIKEITLERDRKCSNCKLPIHKGEKALYITNEELCDRVIVHVLCPKGAEKAFTKWRRPGAPKQIKKIQVKCLNCGYVYGAPESKGVPLRCHFCGTVGFRESIN